MLLVSGNRRVVASPLPCRAQEVHVCERTCRARRELDLAKIEFRNYWQVEYPRIRRHLNAQIELTEAEIRDLQGATATVSAVRPVFDRQRRSWSLQDLRMCLLEAELRLRDLWAERKQSRFASARRSGGMLEAAGPRCTAARGRNWRLPLETARRRRRIAWPVECGRRHRRRMECGQLETAPFELCHLEPPRCSQGGPPVAALLPQRCDDIS